MASQGAEVLSLNDIQPSHGAFFFVVFFEILLLGTLLVVMILGQGRTTSRANSTRPTTIVFYQHKVVEINIVTVTNSSLDFVSVAEVPIATLASTPELSLTASQL